MQNMLSALGTLLSSSTKYGQIPDSPNDVLLLNFTGGNTPTRSLGRSKPTRREPGIQLLVRNSNYLNAVSEINRCIDILLDVNGEIGGKHITKITQFSDVLNLGRDDKNRYEFAVNFIIQIDNAKEV